MRRTPGVGGCRRPGWIRTGAATAELAIVLPIVLFVVFSAIEFSRLNLLKHLAAVSAYEGARHGLVEGAAVSEVEDRVNALIATCVRSPATVTTSPSVLTESTTEITVHVSVPVAGNFWIVPAFTTAPVTGQCSLRTERILSSR